MHDVYASTNTEVYLNSCSKCPARYKTNTKKCLVNRYFKISPSREAFLPSISSLKQAFINNGYCNSEFDRILSKLLHDRDNSSNPTTLLTQPTTLHTQTEVTSTTAVTPSVVIKTPTVTPISTVNQTSTVTPISTVTPTAPTVNTTSTVTQFPTPTLL